MDDLLDKLTHRKFVGVSAALTANLLAHYAVPDTHASSSPESLAHATKVPSQVTWLEAACGCR